MRGRGEGDEEEGKGDEEEGKGWRRREMRRGKGEG